MVSVRSAKEPAAPCIQSGDQVNQVDELKISSLEEAKIALFKEEGTTIKVRLARAKLGVECEFKLAEQKNS